MTLGDLCRSTVHASSNYLERASVAKQRHKPNPPCEMIQKVQQHACLALGVPYQRLNEGRRIYREKEREIKVAVVHELRRLNYSYKHIAELLGLRSHSSVIEIDQATCPASVQETVRLVFKVMGFPVFDAGEPSRSSVPLRPSA